MTIPVPVTIRGVDYPSMTAAAKAFGISVVAIHYARNADRLDTVGLGGEAKKRHVWVTDLGDLSERHFDSCREAAEHLGVSPSTIGNARARAKKIEAKCAMVAGYLVEWDD